MNQRYRPHRVGRVLHLCCANRALRVSFHKAGARSHARERPVCDSEFLANALLLCIPHLEKVEVANDKPAKNLDRKRVVA